MQVKYFCTYFDKNYLPRVLALHASLVRHCQQFRLYALCHDQSSFDSLTRLLLPGVVPVSLHDLERHDTELLDVKSNRSTVEYYFTCTSALCLYVMEHYLDVDLLTYLDADLYFFSNPQPLFEELNSYSIGIIEHRFAPGARRFQRYGIYNVGWLSFRRDEDGIECLKWWRARCLEWCFDRLEGNKFADQKYLNDWPNKFQNVLVMQHKGANVAAWNIANYRIREEFGRVWIDEQPLIFFHFANFKEIKPWLFKTGFGSYMVRPSHVVRRYIFWPYISELNCVAPKQNLTSRIRKLDFHLGSVKKWIRNAGRFVRGLLFQEYIFYFHPEQLTITLEGSYMVLNKREAFYRKVVSEQIIDKDVSILVCGAGSLDKLILSDLGFNNVTLSNLDERMDDSEYVPFKWKYENAETLSFDNDSFDYVIIHAAIHHASSPHKVLTEMYRVARIGLLAFESRDSVIMRIMEKFKFTQTYEHAAVYYDSSGYGGVNNTDIPNYIYRWTEREVEKVIKSYAPYADHDFCYRYGTAFPFTPELEKKAWLKCLLLKIGSPFYWLFVKLFPKQQNLFAFYIKKPKLQDNLFPWLQFNGDKIVFNREWGEKRYKDPPNRHT